MQRERAREDFADGSRHERVLDAATARGLGRLERDPLAASKAAVRGDGAALTRAEALVEAGAPAAARGISELI